MFKKLLLCAGIVAGLHAGEDLEIILRNNTNSSFAVQEIKDNYSNLSSAHIGEGFEIEPKGLFSFKVHTLVEKYYEHCTQKTSSDQIKFLVFGDENKEGVREGTEFSIIWEKDSVRIEPENLSGYQLIKKKSTKNNTFEFVLKTKEIDSGTDF